MLSRHPNYLSVPDFIAFADAVDAFNNTLPAGKRLNIFYIPLRRNSKIPATSKPMYDRDAAGKEIPRPGFTMDRERAIEFLNKNLGNIGILAYNDGENPTLALFDFDIQKNPDGGIGTTVIPKETIAEFTRSHNLAVAITRQGGYHVYVVNDGSLSNANIVYQGKHAGELRCHKMYVVAPGSYVPKLGEDDEKKGKVPTPDATGVYRLLAQRPLKVLSRGDLPDWLSLDVGSDGKKPRVRDVIIKQIDGVRGGNDIRNDLGVTLTEIRARDEKLDGALLHGAVESDRSKVDYAIAWRLRCWGFDDSSVAHILRSYRPSNKTYREGYIELTISKVTRDYEFRPYLDLFADLERIKSSEKKIADHAALQVKQRLGVGDGDEGSEEGIADGYVSEDGVLHLTDFPTLLPDEKYIHLRGLPRIGKSHWTLTQLAAVDSGIYVTSNHDIIEQQFRTFRRLAPDKTAAWIKGKYRCCSRRSSDGRKFDCATCPLLPRSEWNEEADPRRPTTEAAEIAVAGVLKEDRYLCYLGDANPDEEGAVGNNDPIKTNIPSWICPYVALHMAAKEADFVFTVPYYTTAGSDLVSLRPRELMVMDEDTVFKFYAPKSITLFEYGFRGGTSSFTAQSNLVGMLSVGASIKSEIERKDRQTFPEKTVLSIITAYEKIEALFAQVTQNTTPFKHVPEIRDWLTSSIRLIIQGKFEGLSQADRLGVIQELEEYQRKTGHISDDDGIAEFAEALLFPHPDNPVYWDHGNPATLYLIADESRIVRMPMLADKYLLVGFTEGEMFAEQMSRIEFGPEWNQHIAKLHVKRFPYGDNFVVFRVDHEKPRDERRLFHRLVRSIDTIDNDNDWKIPRLTLTASKRHQEATNSRSRSERAIMIQKKHGLKSIMDYSSLLGASMIFYSNSRISRGIDVPHIDVLIADACAFAQPHMSATIEFLKRRLREIEFGAPGDSSALHRQLIDAVRIKESLLTDETTNGVLRISPVIGKGEDQVKIVVIAGQDYRYINPEATEKMQIIPLGPDSNIERVAATVLFASRAVRPESIKKSAATIDARYAEIYAIAPRNTEGTISRPGCVKTQIPEMVEGIGDSVVIDHERVAFREKITDLEEKIIKQTPLSHGHSRKFSLLKKLCYEKFASSPGRAFSRRDVDMALKNLINRKSLIIESRKDGKSKSSRVYQYVRLSERAVTQ